MNTGEVTSIVAVIGMFLSLLGITGIDSSVISSAINGILAIITIGAAVLSWWIHRMNRVSQSQQSN